MKTIRISKGILLAVMITVVSLSILIPSALSDSDDTGAVKNSIDSPNVSENPFCDGSNSDCARNCAETNTDQSSSCCP